MTEMRTGPNREQRCALHLMDLCRAYRDDPARPQALTILEPYRTRAAKLRRQAELKAAQTRASSVSLAASPNGPCSHPAAIAVFDPGAQSASSPMG